MRSIPWFRRQKHPGMRKEDRIKLHGLHHGVPLNPPSDIIVAKALLLNISITYSTDTTTWCLMDKSGRNLEFYKMPLIDVIADRMLISEAVWDDAVNALYHRILEARKNEEHSLRIAILYRGEK